MELDKDTQERLQEMQINEQNLQSFMLQKQSFQLELNETKSALEELEKSDDDLYRIVGQIMIKGKKQEIVKELEEKKHVLELRIKALEKQEKLILDRLENSKKELEKKLEKKK